MFFVSRVAPLKQFLIVIGLTLGTLEPAAMGGECSRVLFDRGNSGEGKAYALALANLLGHFPQYQVILEPVESYTSGQLEDCGANFYIGSQFDNPLPTAFLNDFSTTQQKIVWMGYNLWRIPGGKQEEALGYRYHHLTAIDWTHKDPQGRPGYYRDITYKGEKFWRYGELDVTNPSHFTGAWEMTSLQAGPVPGDILAQAIHSTSALTLPYAVRKTNHYYIADIPFSFIHEADRYLIFADLLFDILSAAPRYPNARPALFRVEDIHHCVDPKLLDQVAVITRSMAIPWAIATIPIYWDPFRVEPGCSDGHPVPMSSDLRFKATLNRMVAAGASLIWHGVTHQYDRHKNPTSGVSGDDYEFWDAHSDEPVSWDQPSSVLDRMEWGWGEFDQSGFHPKIWETPHYQASALDYAIFARLFSWSIGRAVYTEFVSSGLESAIDPTLQFEKTSGAGTLARHRALDSASVRAAPSAQPYGQFYPYEIYGDIYGQRMLPENLGYVHNYYGPGGGNANSIEDLIAEVRRNRVIRDSWASFFFHVQNLALPPPSGLSPDAPLLKLLKEIRSDGYVFINPESFIQAQGSLMRPPVIELP